MFKTYYKEICRDQTSDVIWPRHCNNMIKLKDHFPDETGSLALQRQSPKLTTNDKNIVSMLHAWTWLHQVSQNKQRKLMNQYTDTHTHTPV